MSPRSEGRLHRRGPALDASARSTVLWVGSMWALLILLQRITIPGLPVAILIPVAFFWVLWGLGKGIAELDRGRVGLWSLAFGSAAALVLLQDLVLPAPSISATSILLFATVWAPFMLRLTDRRTETYLVVLRAVCAMSALLAAVAAIMMVSQLLGLRYQDWFGEFLPDIIEYPRAAFVITYPVEYGSEIYRANAWIGLEPSFVSAQIGLGLVAGILARVRLPILLLLFGGMLATTAGSGFLIVLVAGAVMVFSPMRGALLRYVPLVVVAVLASLWTDLGQNLISRAFEGADSRSSTSLRTVLPYFRFWPEWTQDLMTVLMGRGPGSTEDLLPIFNVTGLLVPTPIKIFFEYGLIVGTLIAAFMLLCMFRGPSRSIAFGLVFSLWTLQPGSTTFLIVAPAFLLVTLWAPRTGQPLEQYRELPKQHVGGGRQDAPGKEVLVG